MLSPRTGSTSRPDRRRLTLLAGVAAIGLLPATGCQVEYAGMTLPSGKYMRDDVQYVSPGPDFPWANTQAATQRARMSANGMNVPGAPGAVGIGTAAGGFSPSALGAPIPAVPTGVGPGGAPPGGIPLNEGAAVPNPNPIAPPGAPAPGPAVPGGPAPGAPAPGNVPPPM
jgi:hypothetical protein